MLVRKTNPNLGILDFPDRNGTVYTLYVKMVYPSWESIETDNIIQINNPEDGDSYNILDYCRMIINAGSIMTKNYSKCYGKYFKFFIKYPSTREAIWKLIEQQVLNEYTEKKKLRNSLFLEMFTELRTRLSLIRL